MNLYEVNILDMKLDDIFITTIHLQVTNRTEVEKFISANFENVYWKIANSFSVKDFISIESIPLNGLSMKKHIPVEVKYLEGLDESNKEYTLS